VRSGDRLSVFDLRFGRWIKDLILPPGTTELAVDDGLQRIALGSASGLELVRPDALAAPPNSELVAEAPHGDAAQASPSDGEPDGTGAVEVSPQADLEPPDEQPPAEEPAPGEAN